MDKVPNLITDLTVSQLESHVKSMGEPAYRVKQIQKWLYRNMACSYDEMTDLPKAFRERLAREFRLCSLRDIREIKGQNRTVKTAFSLHDGNVIESVLMSHQGSSGSRRYTVCISTQVGCPIDCPYCATGQQGFERNLSPGEIVDQVVYLARRLQIKEDELGDGMKKGDSKISNIVFMGMGEPLANYDSLWQAIEVLNSQDGFGLGARNMTISTAGLVPQIERLSHQQLQVGLAVSLHASDNVLRDRLVPVNRTYPLEKLIPACREYYRLTGRRPSFQYVLFRGINDSTMQARSLAGLLHGLNCHVNLIAANSTGNHSFKSPSAKDVLAFESELKRLRVNVTVRESRGQDIAAGCGQLSSRLR